MLPAFCIGLQVNEMKAIINHNQICTWRSIQNTIDKYSWIL